VRPFREEDRPRRVYTVWRRTPAGVEVWGPEGPVAFNHSAARIWELIDGRRTVAEIIADLAPAYPGAGAQTLRSDALSFLSHLAAGDLIAPTWPPDGWQASLADGAGASAVMVNGGAVASTAEAGPAAGRGGIHDAVVAADVLLVLPPPGRPYPRDFTSFAPPLGLAYLGAALERAGYRTAIRDYYARPFDARAFDSLLQEAGPRVVGLSAYTENYPTALFLAARVKRLDPTARVVLGGPHITGARLDRPPSPGVDAVARGEADDSLVQLVRHWLEPGGSRGWDRPVAGVTFRGSGGRLTDGGPEPPAVDPAAVPPPARHLLDLNAYPVPGCLLTARGCGQACIFCSSWHGSGRRLRPNAIDRVIDELDQMPMLPVHAQGEGCRVHFWDESFTVDRERTLALCRRLRSTAPGLRWSAGTRVDAVDPELLDAMAAAGCVALNFGVESGVPALLRQLGKGIRLDQVERAVRWTVERGLYTTCNFMLPAPGDTPETVRRTRDYAVTLLGLGAKGISFNISTPFPGTALYERADSLGIRLQSAPWEDYHYWNPVMATRWLEASTIRELYFEAALAVASRTPAPPASPTGDPSSALNCRGS